MNAWCSFEVQEDVDFVAGQVMFDGELDMNLSGENAIGRTTQKLRQSSGVFDEQFPALDSYTVVHELASTRDGQSRGGHMMARWLSPEPLLKVSAGIQSKNPTLASFFWMAVG